LPKSSAQVRLTDFLSELIEKADPAQELNHEFWQVYDWFLAISSEACHFTQPVSKICNYLLRLHPSLEGF
jgi:hypothetical protein